MLPKWTVFGKVGGLTKTVLGTNWEIITPAGRVFKNKCSTLFDSSFDLFSMSHEVHDRLVWTRTTKSSWV